jgi:prepilin-type processing-associated H-X9-DG protein
VLGLLALVTALIGGGLLIVGDWTGLIGSLILCVSGLVGLPALICGGIGMTRPVKRGTATAGMLLGLLGVLAGIGGLGSSMFFSVNRVREAAARMKDQNNLKQMSLAVYDNERQYESISQYARDERGQAQEGLSFRVGLLPYMGESSLHRQFDLSQSWDSPRNRPHSNTPVMTYISPLDQKPTTIETPYRTFVGGGAIFDERSKSTSIISITDGTSNTILFIHATEQVPWASPRELKYDPNGPLPTFGHPTVPTGYNVAMADGSVRFIRKTIPEKTLRMMITKSGGEVTPVGDW